MQTNPIDYQFINTAEMAAAGVDVSTTRIMPVIAAERGGWSDQYAVLAEDWMFLYEAAVEREMLSGVTPYSHPTIVPIYSPFLQVANALRQVATAWIDTSKNTTDTPYNWRYTDGTGAAWNQDVTFADYALSASDLSSGIPAHPFPFVYDRVKNLYQDMRKFTNAGYATGIDIHTDRLDWTHSNASAFAPTGNGIVYSWEVRKKWEGGTMTYENDVATANAGLSTNRAMYFTVGAQHNGHSIRPVLVFEVHLEAGNYPEPTATELEWTALTPALSFSLWGNNSFYNGKYTLRPQYTDPSTIAASGQGVGFFTQYYPNVTTSPPGNTLGNEALRMRVVATMASRVSRSTDWRTGLSQWIDANGQIIAS